MANNYIRPQLEVFQQLEVTRRVTGEHLTACIVGANYDLHRYGHEDLTPTSFSSNETLIPFVFEQSPALDYKVDLGSVAVYAEGLEAALATFTNTTTVDRADVMILRTNNGKMFVSATEANLDPVLKGCPVSIGDIVYVTGKAGDTPRRRTVIDVIGKRVPEVITPGDIAAADKTLTLGATTSSDVSITTGSTFTGDKGTTYVVQVVAAPTAAGTFEGAELKVTDTSGIDLAAFVKVPSKTGDVVIGTMGLKLTLNIHTTTTKLTVGDTFSIICTPATASTTEYDGIRLDSMAVDAAFDVATPIAAVELRKMYTGGLPSDDAPDAAWKASEAGVTLAPAACMYIPKRKTDKYAPFVNSVGSLFIEFRVLIIPNVDEEIYTIGSLSDITAAFGTIDPANELAFACKCCLAGSQGREFFAIRVPSTDVAGYMEAIKKTEADTATYSFAPVTSNLDIADAVVEFNNTMSQPEVKKWRRTIIGADSPGEYAVASADNKGKILKATFTADNTGAFRLVQIPEDVAFDFKNVSVNGYPTKLHPGDKIQMSSTGVKYAIAAVLSSKEVLLATGPTTKVVPAMPIVVWKADTALNASDFVISVAKRFNTRRALVVWCDGGVYDRTPAFDKIENKFVAAEIAGLSSAVVPQKSITHTELVTVSRATRMYTQYTQDKLDDIAAAGVLIVTQDTKNTPCYIRHQLTTEMDKGNLYFEDSCTRNIDNISYALTDILEPYIGRANVTTSALRQIETEITNKLIEFTTDTTDALVGPSLIEWKDLVIYQDPVFKDRLIIKVKLYLPLPLNNIKLYEQAFIATVAI